MIGVGKQVGKLMMKAKGAAIGFLRRTRERYV
jgi:hypothetical protein